MAIVFDSKETVFFVGGDAYTGQVSTVQPGGCTKAFYDDEGVALDLSKIMGADGVALIGVVNGTPSGGNTLTKADAFGSAKPGMIAYLFGTHVDLHGRHEILTVPDANTITFAALTFIGVTADVTCNIGGAYDLLQTAVDGSDAQTNNVFIFDNRNGSPEQQIDFDTTGGNIGNNTQMIIEGFHTLPGDMNKGGTYYQSPLDALTNGVDVTCSRNHDGEAVASDLFSIDNFDGLVIKNFYVHNTSQGVGYNCVEFLNSPYNISFINCKFDDAYQAFAGAIYTLKLDSCYVGNDFAHSTQSSLVSSGGSCVNCVFNGDGSSYCFRNDYATYSQCLFYKSDSGVYCIRGNNFESCIFYGQKVCCIGVISGTTANVCGHNNIFMPAAAAVIVVYSATATGSVSDDTLTNSCIWTVADVAVTNHISIIGELKQLSSVTEANPQFVDALNNDFRLLPTSPCLNTGKSTIGNSNDDEGYTNMGAWQRKSFLGMD